MIDIQVKIHDRFSVEFKVGFRSAAEFSMNTWIFVPHSLGIDPSSYGKKRFYRDIKTNLRLITPVFLLRDIAQGAAIPLTNLERSFARMASDPSRSNAVDYLYHIKMFSAIFKSALRDLVRHILQSNVSGAREVMIHECLQNIRVTLTKYRALGQVINVPTVPPDQFEYFCFGDEFMSNVAEFQLFKLLDNVRNHHQALYESVASEILLIITEENAYKQQNGYLTVSEHSANGHRDVVFRRGMLKKFIESDLFLNANKKRQGVVSEQISMSIAAGVSMVFATAVAFAFQLRYGNFTFPLFCALVASYMLKDRIKDLMRYYFAAHKRGSRYFDNKTTLDIKEQEIGWVKEGFDFITESKVPPEVVQRRSRSSLLQADNLQSNEKIILYRKLVQIDRTALNKDALYTLDGVNDIFRFNISRFLQDMDNAEVPLYYVDNQTKIKTAVGNKVYYVNFIVQLKDENCEEFLRYRLVINRNGIQEIENI